jgi:hypothetical protein
VVPPLLDAFAAFRDRVRASARGKGTRAGSTLSYRVEIDESEHCGCAEVDAEALLKLSDGVRDEVLPKLGVRLEDKGATAPSVWKFDDPEAILRDTRLTKEVRACVRVLQVDSTNRSSVF